MSTPTALRTFNGGPVWVCLDVTSELAMAREALAETGSAGIHDDSAMIDAAVRLSIRLASLVAAVEAGGER